MVLNANRATVEKENEIPWNSLTTVTISTDLETEYKYIQRPVVAPVTAIINFLLILSLERPAKGRANMAASDIRPEIVAATATVAPTLMAYLDTIGVIIWEEAWFTMLSSRIMIYHLFHSLVGS